MSATRPAGARRSYQQFCPIARTLDVLGDRWVLLIVRNLYVGPQRFTDLQRHLPGLAPSLLAQRLRELEVAGIVHQIELAPPAARKVYALTERGRDLGPVVYELARFGLPYLDLPTDEQPLRPELLVGGLLGLVLLEELPRRALVAHLALDEGDFALRIHPQQGGPPLRRVEFTNGAPERSDVTIHASAPVMLWIRRGDLTLDDARAQGLVSFDGDDAAVAALKQLFGFSETARA